MRIKISLFVGALFFLVALATLPHYGINWDTINHLPRGQAYLRYMLTGKTNYADMPVHFQDWFKSSDWFFQDPSALFIKTNLPEGQFVDRSYYQNDGLNYEYFIEHDGGGHPPLSDILSAATNRLLYSKLHLVNDVDAYRVYGIALAAALVSLVYFWTSQKYGTGAGLVASLSLATYPLFWSESHFNTEKDIPEAVFWSFFLFTFWKAINTKKLLWFTLSGVFAGLALGTKFNILFSIFVIVPWFVFYLFNQKHKVRFTLLFFKSVKTWVGFLLVPCLMFGIFVLFWPYLWADPIGRVQSVISFYKEIGTTTSEVSRYTTIFGFNTFPLVWIITTTPLIVLFLSAIGIVYSLLNLKKHEDKFELLILLWLAVPILRVVWPHASTYGGVRQLMEYIPALAIFSGIGYAGLLSFSKKYIYAVPAVLAVVTFGFVVLITTLVSIHPNENVYFNGLIGGLSGAKKQDLPYWGFSFGTPYREAVTWINQNVEQDATLVFAYELIPNFPRLWLRPDIKLINAERSGYLMKGEYAITLNYQGTDTRSYYDLFLNRFISPVYTAQVDGVPIVSVWKNDKEHLTQKVEEHEVSGAKFETSETSILISLKSPVNLWRVEIDYFEKDCKGLVWGYTQTSLDTKTWTRLPGTLPDDWRISAMGEQPKAGRFIEPFVGDSAQYIRFMVNPSNTCLKNIKKLKVISL